MRYVKIISAAIVLAVCVAVVYQLIGKKEREIKEDFSNRYFIQNNIKTVEDIIKTNQITEIHIVNPNGEFNFAPNEYGEWMITQPIRTKAGAQMVNSMLKTLVFMEVDRVVEKNPDELEKYGLKNPDIKIKYRLEGSDEWHRIHFGRRSPVEGSYYAMDPDKGEVVLVNYQYKFDFNATLHEYRERQLFPAFSSKPDFISLDFKNKSYHFKLDYKYKLWRMEKPKRAIAEKKKMQSVINMLTNMQIIAFLPPEKIPDAPGFDAPALVLELKLPDLGKKKLVIGKRFPDKKGYRYAKSTAHDSIFLAREQLWLEKIPKKLREVESNRALRLFGARAKTISFRKNGEELKLINTKKPRKWTIFGHEDLKFDFLALRKTVKKINSFKIRERTWISADQAIKSDFGFDNPSAIITIIYREDSERPDYEAVFGDEDVSGKYVYLYSTIDPQVRLVDKEILYKIPVEAEHFTHTKREE